jgi:hypothetical protein
MCSVGVAGPTSNLVNVYSGRFQDNARIRVPLISSSTTNSALREVHADVNIDGAYKARSECTLRSSSTFSSRKVHPCPSDQERACRGATT